MVNKMPRLRILFADDQIPDESIPDDSLESTLREQYPQLSMDSILEMDFRESPECELRRITLLGIRVNSRR
jgi:hypothetical protein